MQPSAQSDVVQVRALLLPRDVHEQLKSEAQKQMRNITAQAVFDLTNMYRQKAAKEGKAA